MKVILISGKARHGKDTFAEMLRKKLEDDGNRVLVAHYGDLVKYVCKTFFGWNGEKDEYGRHILQYVGTDVIRNQKEDYWVKFITDMLEFFGDNWDYVLIPDTRFPNEVEKMKSRFDTIHLRILRPDFDNGLTEEQKNHPSETALDNVQPDYLVINGRGFEELLDNVEFFVDDKIFGLPASQKNTLKHLVEVC